MAELRERADALRIPGYAALKKSELVLPAAAGAGRAAGTTSSAQGVLDLVEEGFGFLRADRLLPGGDDVYVSLSQIRRFGLRTGDMVAGQVRPPKESEKYFGLLRVEAVNGVDPETAKRRPNFDDLTPVYPHQRLLLETSPDILATRLLDLVAPIGKRPARPDRGTAQSRQDHPAPADRQRDHRQPPGSDVMLVLVGERPEEVTDMERPVLGAEVVSATFDEPLETHTRVAEMALERAKRLVEGGRDVVILLDSITRLTRAYNLATPSSGRTLSGGVDPGALFPPKRFFGAARKIEGAGSLTVIATCLVDTGSRMDDVIYEEFKGTGNMEVHLSRELAERRIFPAIDIQRSGTRHEELLLDTATMARVVLMHRMLAAVGISEGTELLLSALARSENNQAFLATLNTGEMG